MTSASANPLLDFLNRAQIRLHPFRQRVFQDPMLMRQLQEVSDWEPFTALVVRLSREQGCPVAAEDLLLVRQMAGLLDRSGILTPELELTTAVARLNGWMPLRITWRAGRPFVNWYVLGKQRFTDPFFSHTVWKCLQEPFNTLFWQQTSMETLGAVVEDLLSAPPAGIIYHMSRCGSTLISQMLSALPQTIVLSEPDPVGTLLQASTQNPAITEAQCIPWLTWIFCALAQRRFDSERYLIIKLEGWQILDFPLLRRVFPQVPWIYLYREPLEVMAAYHRESGIQAILSQVARFLPGLEGQNAVVSEEERVAQILAALCSAALTHVADGGRLVNYRELPEAALTWLPEYFGVSFSATEREKMRHVTHQNAKTPTLPFEKDGRQKQAEATEEIRRLSRNRIEPVYAQLETVRQAQIPF